MHSYNLITYLQSLVVCLLLASPEISIAKLLHPARRRRKPHWRCPKLVVTWPQPRPMFPIFKSENAEIMKLMKQQGVKISYEIKTQHLTFWDNYTIGVCANLSRKSPSKLGWKWDHLWSRIVLTLARERSPRNPFAKAITHWEGKCCPCALTKSNSICKGTWHQKTEAWRCSSGVFQIIRRFHQTIVCHEIWSCFKAFICRFCKYEKQKLFEILTLYKIVITWIYLTVKQFKTLELLGCILHVLAILPMNMFCTPHSHTSHQWMFYEPKISMQNKKQPSYDKLNLMKQPKNRKKKQTNDKLMTW